jgi:2-dehydro-3-deoxyglucarate aldolase/4-hydroxy-2-oxoheptanedioate aldolase
MSARRPSLREAFAGGACLDAVWLSLGSVAITEMAARSGAGLLVIDMQHGLFDRVTLEAAVGLAAPHAPVMVRVADHSPAAISQALDAGAEGVLVPLVESAAQAAAAVSAARFPPQGARSGGGVRPLHDFAAYVREAGAATVVGAMIETRAGLAAAGAIAGCDGIDLIFIGAGDLSLSLGEFPAPGAAHAKACADILAAASAHGRPCGIFTGSAEAARRMREAGYRLVVSANDIDLVRGGLARARREFAAKENGAPK